MSEALAERTARWQGLALYQWPEEYGQLSALYEARDEIAAEMGTANEETAAALATELEAADREIARREEEFRTHLAERGQSAAAYLRALKATTTAAKAEVERVAGIARVLERREQRVKALVLSTLQAMDLKKLSGPTWGLTVAGNGGVQPIAYEGAPKDLPLELRAKVTVDPVALRDRMVKFFGDRDGTLEYWLAHVEVIDAFLRDALWPVTPPAPNLERVRAQIQETGEVPEGFTLLPKGSHLLVK